MEGLRKQIAFLKGLNIIHFGGKAVLLPFLPLFLIDQGFSAMEVGLIMGAGPFIGVFAQPVVGYISDRYKTVKKMLLILHVIVLVVSVGIFFGDHFVLVLTSMLFMYFALSPCTPLVDSIVLLTLGSRRREYGLIRLWGSIA